MAISVTIATLPAGARDARLKALILTLLAGPAIGFLYLGRVRLSLRYLLYTGTVVTALAELYVMDFAFEDALTYGIFFLLLVHAAGALHVANLSGLLTEGRFPGFCRILAVALALLLWALVLGCGYAGYCWIFRMPGAFMVPSIGVDAPVVLNALAYRSSDPQRGDVIAFRRPDAVGAVTRVSRIIGLPGDRVAMKMGVLYLNGVPVSERPLPDYHPDRFDPGASLPCFLETLPEGASHAVLAGRARGTGHFENHPERVVPPASYYVLGDNRPASRDSRDLTAIGYVARPWITGKVYGMKLTPATLDQIRQLVPFY